MHAPSWHTSTPFHPKSSYRYRQYAELYERKAFLTQETNLFSLVLPYAWFSSVAGRGNLTKEAPARVTTCAFNDIAQNLQILMQFCDRFLVNIDEPSLGMCAGFPLTGMSVRKRKGEDIRYFRVEQEEQYEDALRRDTFAWSLEDYY